MYLQGVYFHVCNKKEAGSDTSLLDKSRPSSFAGNPILIYII